MPPKAIFKQNNIDDVSQDNFIDPSELVKKSEEKSNVRVLRQQNAKQLEQQKAQDIYNNPYLPKPDNDSFHDSAATQIPEGVKKAIQEPSAIPKKNKDRKSTDSRSNISKPSQMEKEERVNALQNAADDNNIQISRNERQAKLKRDIQSVKAVLKRHQIDITNREAAKMIKHGFKHSFPAGMFAVSVTKDAIIDPLANVFSLGLTALGITSSATVVGAPIGIAASGAGLAIGMANTIIIAPISIAAKSWLNGLYINNSIGDRKVASKVIKKLIVGNVAVAATETLPIVNVIPTNIARTLLINAFVRRLLAECKAATSGK